MGSLPRELRGVSREAVHRELCRRSAHHFVFEFCRTKDEHDLEHPVKQIPSHPYLRALLDLLLVSGRFCQPEKAVYALAWGMDHAWLESLRLSAILAVEKSRQMMVTWLVCAYCLWRAKYHPHQLILVQSKREDDAANLVFSKEPTVGRISFLETTLPKFLRTMEFPKAGSYCHLYLPNGSHIWGIPEGGDIVRSNTPSLLFCDEAAFQPDFGGSISAALPAIKGGGQYVAVSSAEPGEFQAFVESE